MLRLQALGLQAVLCDGGAGAAAAGRGCVALRALPAAAGGSAQLNAVALAGAPSVPMPGAVHAHKVAVGGDVAAFAAPGCAGPFASLREAVAAACCTEWCRQGGVHGCSRSGRRAAAVWEWEWEWEEYMDVLAEVLVARAGGWVEQGSLEWYS